MKIGLGRIASSLRATQIKRDKEGGKHSGGWQRKKGKKMKIARVFPRITNATPHDDYTFFEEPGMFLPPISEVHISVTFTYDLKRAEQLARAWEHIAPVKIGGFALNNRGGEFEPGMYVKKGSVMTSRGCPNKCWFCRVPIVEGDIRELEIREGHNILDSNLLACSESHIRAVFTMLKQQKEKPIFTGGLEAKILKPWHCDLLREVNAGRMYFAYDTKDDYEPLVQAGKMLRESGITNSHTTCCYVLMGYKSDTFDKAEKRLIDTIKAGFMPFAMLYKDEQGHEDKEWRKFQREWCRPAIVGSKMREIGVIL